ncbi:MAG TPA: hypothetical protein VH744_07675 [Terriglobales bacterium]
MITREDIRELSQVRFKEEDNCALSFYFQPRTPRNKSHREEAIQAKDLVRNAMREVEKNGRNARAKADLQRILELAERLHGNQARAKAVFAYGARNFWREFDLPPQLPGTRLFVNQRFHLKPLAMLLGAQPKLGVALIDRQRARLFELRLDELTERKGLFHPLPRRGRSDGYAGYDGGHSQRRADDEALHHFKTVAHTLKEQAEKGVWEKLIIGCHEKSWPDLEAQLHPFVKQRLLGHFSVEVNTAQDDKIRASAQRIFHESLQRRQHELVHEVLSHAKSHRRGVTGVRRVLRSLELGEVQTLLIGEQFCARAVECTSCGHLDSHLVRFCPACGKAARQLEDVSDAIIPAAIRRDIEVHYVKDDPDLDRVGNIAALLRYRAEKPANMLAAS